jgi:glutathione S-transferase
MSSEKVVLRYFPVRGRAQALRDALADRRIAFEDVRPAPGEWPRHREDARFAGPFRALPTLSWGDVHVAETLPIASFIARRTGQFDALADGAIARLEAICSCVYIDVMLRIAGVLRADLSYPGADPARGFASALPQMVQKLELLEKELGTEPWFGGGEPVVADFFVAEGIDALLYTLGPSRRAALTTRLPRLTDLARRALDRPAVVKANESRAARFTGRPDEDVVVEALRSADLSATGL